MQPRLSWVRGVCAAIRAAKSFDNQPTDAQAVELCHALLLRLGETQNRVITLEAQVNALEARLNRLERKKKIRKAA
jgi:hypothetical protein